MSIKQTMMDIARKTTCAIFGGFMTAEIGQSLRCFAAFTPCGLPGAPPGMAAILEALP